MSELKKITNRRWRNDRLLSRKERKYTSPFTRFTRLSDRLDNLSSPISLIETKALQVIKNQTFIIPQHLTDDQGLRMKPNQAGQYILERWPLQEAAKILEVIDEAEFFCFQGLTARLIRGQDSFSIPFFHLGSSILNQQSVTNFGSTNIFWQKYINEENLRSSFGHSPEATEQNYYQNIGLNNVYKEEIQRLLKLQRRIPERDSLNGYSNTMVIVALPKEQRVLVLAEIGENATDRNKREPIIFQTKEVQKLVNFLSTHKQQGLNAVFSLILSQELTPHASFPKSLAFYANEQPKILITTDGQLEEFEFKKYGKTPIGNAKRLRPIKD